MDTISNHRAPARPVVVKILIGAAVTCLLFAAGLGGFALLKTTTSHTGTAIEKHPQRPIADQDTASAQAITKQYMDAFLEGRYTTMWSMLHPQIQSLWPNENAYGAFWKGRYHDYTLQGFTIGRTQKLPYWVNPETMITYTNVLMQPVSLQLTLKKTAQTPSLLPPENVQPSRTLQNVPFIVQRTPQAGNNQQDVILNGGPADIEAPMLPPLTNPKRTLQVPIMMYHHISNTPARDQLDLSLTVTPSEFSKQLDYLKKRGYHTITFNQLFAALYYHGPLPVKPIILSFDDGYDDAYKFAYPILKAHSYSGMFYIISGKVGWKGQARWQQLRTMLSNGMQVGSHTVNHVDIGQTLMISQQTAQKELRDSQHTLQTLLDTPIQQFCYPSGEPFRNDSVALQEQIVVLLSQDGYIGATTDPGPTGTTQDSQKPFELRRIRVDGRSDLQTFINSLPW